MEWSRIPTALLTDRVPERDLIAVVKYQLLWAYQEQEPTPEVLNRYLTSNQVERALEYYDCISAMVIPDVKGLVSKRGRDKKKYHKNKAIQKNNTDETVKETAVYTIDGSTEQIRDENNKLNKTIINENPQRPFGAREEERTIKSKNNPDGFRGIPLPNPLKS